jgi:hypothetical protein
MFPKHNPSVIRWIEQGVKVEFKKGLAFAPKPSAPKVDPQDVDFAIKDLLKGRRIGASKECFTPPKSRNV